MSIPTSGTGAVHSNPKIVVGVDHWNVNVRDYINILMSYHQLSLVYSLLDASYEAYASYEYRFLTFFFGSAT